MKQIVHGQGDVKGGSPPARGRGLKREYAGDKIPDRLSPPARGRGLKHLRADRHLPHLRRPPHGGVD